MKKLIRTLLLVMVACMVLSPIAMAQDALSAILPSPYSSRVGSQLIYFYEDGNNLGPRGQFKSFLTITNTSLTASVVVHFQFYSIVTTSGTSTTCQELFDFVGTLTAGHRHIIDPQAVRRPSSSGSGAGALVGTATDGRFIMTATPIVSATANDYSAMAFNWLTGQIWMSDAGKFYTRMTNAVPRMAVDLFGNPLADNTAVLGPVDSNNIATGGNGNILQLFRPKILSVNSFFRTAGAGAVQSGVPFGNRLTLMSIEDKYASGADKFYSIGAASATLSSFVFDDQERAFSVQPNPFTCLQEYVIAPDVANAAGNFRDFLGNGSLTSAVNNTGGWLRMRVAYTAGKIQSVLGWFSQALGPFGGGDYLIGQGREALAVGTPSVNLLVTTAPGGVMATATSTNTPPLP